MEVDEPTVAPGTEPDSATAVRELPFEFRGSGSEYFRIWIVNLLLMIVTLGIYSAWAKVRRLRYFYGSTSLDGHSFDYHGRPIAILKGRLIAFGLYLAFSIGARWAPWLALVMMPVFMLGVPWIIMRARRFQMRMTSWRGLRFGFRGGYGGAFAAFVGWPILGVLTLGALLPFALQRQAAYALGNSSYGNQPFKFTARPGRFYGFYALTALIAIGTVIAALMGVGAISLALGLNKPFVGDPLNRIAVLRHFLLNGGALVSVIFVIALLIPGAFFRKSLLNVSFGSLEIGPHRTQAQLRMWPLAWIMVSNFVATICTLGIFYPWAKVRLVRYQLANMSVRAHGDLDRFTAAAADGTGAVGEEISDFFDIDFGL